MEKHFVVIDPAVKTAEVDCFNNIVHMAGQRCTYHLPGIQGIGSLAKESVDRLQGVVILGSAASVHDHFSWQSGLLEWLQPIFNRQVPTLGICYGHQLLAHHFGGEVRFINDARTKQSGLRKVKFSGDSIFGEGEDELVVSHCEIVSKAPSSMREIARSDLFSLDALQHQTLPVFTFQPHPEATSEFLKDRGIQAPPERLRFGNSLVSKFLQFASRSR